MDTDKHGLNILRYRRSSAANSSWTFYHWPLHPESGTLEIRGPHLNKGTNMKVGVAGQGAFGQKHMDAIQNIPGIELITLTGGNPVATEEVAKKYKIPHFTCDLAESLKQPGLDAMILATPTRMHASQAIQCMR